MRETILELVDKFNKIKEKGYIKGIYNGSLAIGRTFEHELGLEMNKMSMPDYNGIEIKTRRTYTKNTITLINATPDGEIEGEIPRIKEKYGYPYYKDRNYKCLYAEVFANKKTFSGRCYQYKLLIDDKEEKIYLGIYNYQGIMIEKKAYWSYEYLKNKLQNKLNYLALIHAWPKKIDDWNYFKYYDIGLWKYQGFDKFKYLLERGIIKLTLKVDIYLDENNYGKIYNHGCGFSIQEELLSELFYAYDIPTGLLV